MVAQVAANAAPEACRKRKERQMPERLKTKPLSHVYASFEIQFSNLMFILAARRVVYPIGRTKHGTEVSSTVAPHFLQALVVRL